MCAAGCFHDAMPASFREKGHKGEGGIARRLLLKAAGG